MLVLLPRCVIVQPEFTLLIHYRKSGKSGSTSFLSVSVHRQRIVSIKFSVCSSHPGHKHSHSSYPSLFLVPWSPLSDAINLYAPAISLSSITPSHHLLATHLLEFRRIPRGGHRAQLQAACRLFACCGCRRRCNPYRRVHRRYRHSLGLQGDEGNRLALERNRGLVRRR